MLSSFYLMSHSPTSGDDTSVTNTRRRFLATGAALGGAVIAGCTTEEDSTGDELSGDIDIAGSSTVFPLMSAIAEDFEAEHDQVNINISSTGSGGGFSNYFCPGDTDFNNASRAIKEEEENLCAENDVEYLELQVATDALTVVINNDNTFAEELTVEELAQIWKADAAETWQDVNSDWPNEPIERYGAADTSGTYDYFIENIMGDRGHTDDYQATEQDNTIVQGVSGSEYAIGYFGFAYYYQNPEQVKAVAIDDGDGAVEPSLQTASEGEYTPLSRPLFTYPSLSSLGEEHIAEFARYVVEQLTNEQLIAEDVGYVPLTEDQQQTQMDKLEDALDQA